MNFKNIYSAGILLAIGLVAVGNGFAQETAKVFDQTTIGYARVDLQTLDMPALQMQVNAFVELLDDKDSSQMIIDGFFQGVTPMVDLLKQRGVTEIYAMLSLSDVGTSGPYFYFVCPTNQHAKVQQFVGNFGGGMQTTPVDGGVLMGPPNVFKRLSENKSPRTDLVAAFKKHGTSPIAFVFCPSPDQRKAMTEAMVELPTPFDFFSGQQIAEGGTISSLRIDPKQDAVLELEFDGESFEQNRLLAKSLKQFVTKLAAGQIDVPQPDMKIIFQAVGAALESTDLSQLDNPSDEGRFAVQFKESDGSLKKMLASMRAPVNSVRNAARGAQNSNNLRAALLACHSYHDANRAFPDLAITDDAGKPLLSWRVAVLPFINERPLYEKFKLNEPWDSPHNKELIPLMPGSYASRTPDKDNLFVTRWMMVAGENNVGQTTGISFMDITDGTSRTIMFVEVSQDEAVPWTQPTDWDVGAEEALNKLFEGQDKVTFGYADGSVRVLDKQDIETIRNNLTINGSDDIE